MFTLELHLNAEGGKQDIYGLKEEIMRIASQYNANCQATLTDGKGFQETISATFQPIFDVSVDDCIDMTLTGDQQYEILLLKEKTGEDSPK